MRYSWKPKRWWLTLFGYWIVSSVAAGLAARAGVGPAHTMHTLLILPIIAVTAFTDRSWPTWGRIVWFLSAIPLHAILSYTIGLPFLFLATFAGRGHLADRAAYLFGGIFLLVYSMRRSTLFVSASSEQEEK